MNELQKSDKELAVMAAVGYVQSWNAISQTQHSHEPIDSTRFSQILETLYLKIKSLDQS